MTLKSSNPNRGEGGGGQWSPHFGKKTDLYPFFFVMKTKDAIITTTSKLLNILIISTGGILMEVNEWGYRNPPVGQPQIFNKEVKKVKNK